MLPTPSDIIAGTITLENGSTALVGVGTTWTVDDVRNGDLFVFIDGADGFQLPIIESITDNTNGVLAEPWAGPDLTSVRYRIRYQWDSSRVSAQSRNLIVKLDNGNIQALAELIGPGVPVFNASHSMEIKPEANFINGVAYNVQVDTLPDRAAYDGQSAGFAVLISDMGDGRSAVTSKNTNTVADWSDPAYLTGEVGPMPTVEAGTLTTGAPGTALDITVDPVLGGYEINFTIPAAPGFYWENAYNPALGYAESSVVRNNGSSFIAIQAVPAGQAPSSAFPPVDTAYWEVLASRGQNGTGTGTVVGPSLSVDNRIAVFDGITGESIKDGGKTIAEIISSIPQPIPVAPQGRLSLNSLAATPEADLSGQTSIWYIPCGGVFVPVFDGSVITPRNMGAGLVLPLDPTSGHSGYHQSGMIYDLFAFMDGGTLRLGTGVRWDAGSVAGSSASGASFRGTGAGSTELELYQGLLVNKNILAIRWGAGSGDTASAVPARQATYLGSFVATADGQATDSKAKRLLFNAYSRMTRTLRFVVAQGGPYDGYSYTVAAWRQAAGFAGYQVEFLLGLSGVAVSAENVEVATAAAAAVNMTVGIGLNSSTVPSTDCAQGYNAFTPSGGVASALATYRGFPGIGRHSLKAIEQGGAGMTFYNSGAGMYGEFLG